MRRGERVNIERPRADPWPGVVLELERVSARVVVLFDGVPEAMLVPYKKLRYRHQHATIDDQVPAWMRKPKGWADHPADCICKQRG